VYNVRFLITFLDYVLDLMDLDSRFRRRLSRPPRLYIEVLVLKEVFKVSLRYAECLSLIYFGIRVPNSILHYWELKHGDLLENVLKTLFNYLYYIEYDYSVMDSTKFTDWVKGLHELFVSVRVKSGSTLFQYMPY